MLNNWLLLSAKRLYQPTKKNSDFYRKYWSRYSTLKITHFEGMDNFMKMLIPLFPNCAMDDLWKS